MKNNPYLDVLNFIYDLIYLENRINLEPKDLKVCIKNINDAHFVITNKIAGENRAKTCAKEAISDDYFKNKSLKELDKLIERVILEHIEKLHSTGKIIFIGDGIENGGNDYPLAELMDNMSGCDWYHTKGWEQTKQILESLSD